MIVRREAAPARQYSSMAGGRSSGKRAAREAKLDRRRAREAGLVVWWHQLDDPAFRGILDEAERCLPPHEAWDRKTQVHFAVQRALGNA